MAAVGFDLYTRMLAEAVEVEKAALEGREARTARTQAKIDLPVDAYLPDEYVPEEPQKLELYRRLGRVVSDDGLAEIRAELLDRYGALPAPVERLLEVSRLALSRGGGRALLGRPRGRLSWSCVSALTGHEPTRCAPLRRRSVDDPLRALQGRIKYASNQVRVRLPQDRNDAWRLTQALVDRLATVAR